MAWILTPDALADIEQIAVDGALMFGRGQAERYEADLVDRLDALAAYPYLVAVHITNGMELRLMPSGRHHILYIVEGGDVVVLRVLHALQNWPDLI